MNYHDKTKEGLVLIEKYQVFYNYIYNPLLTAPRRHKTFRDKFIETLLDQFQLLHEAIKSNQVSKVYLADAGIANIRSQLKLCPSKNVQRRILSLKQVENSEALLSEVGKILGKMLLGYKK